MALKVPKNISSDRPYVGLEIRVLTPGRAREQANGAPRQAVPVIARNHIIGADGLDEPVYTNLEIWANTYRPNGSTKPNWEFFFLTEPPKEKTTYDYQFSASVIVGDTWGKRSRWVGVSGTGNKIRFQINVPTTDFDKRVVQIVIARQTSQGPVVVHKERITSGGSKTIDVPTSNLQAPNFKALYSQTEPKYGPVLSDNQRIIVGGPTSAFLSHVGDGLSWKLRPDDELDGTVVPLPDSMMFVTKYSGKPFFVSGSDTYVLVNENAFNVTFLPSSSSVSPTTQYDTNNMPIWSNMLVGLMHIGEDGFYQGEQKLIAFTERLPHTIKGLYVDDLIFTPLLVVEKTDSIDIYWSDTSTPGFVRWSLERESEERTVNQILYMGGYLYIVTAKGFSQDRPNLQIMKVGSSTNTVPLNRVHYRTNPLRSPVGLRARKMRGIFVDPTDHTSNIDKVSVSFYRKPFHDPSYTSSLITTQTLKNHKTVSVRHRDMKLEALNIEIKWLDPGSVLHRLELITYPGVNW
ncbi:MAG: hypothetical protein KatS3mg087_0418 [Patescibacteria group bacterium]|nr:MAG: hypothetical protein KatS3mg087_0418 [Patescibacteria group bacterium]